MIEDERCLSPRRGLSIREGREDSRGDCNRDDCSDCEEEGDALGSTGKMIWIDGLSAELDAIAKV